MEANTPLRRAERRNKRSRSGCNICRARKVKCDERPNGCANCERLQLVCSGYNDRSGARESTLHARVRRTYKSCTECRRVRGKCSGERPVCARCQEKHIECQYGENTEPVWASRLASTLPLADTSTSDGQRPTTQPEPESETGLLSWLASPNLPDKGKVAMLVDHYFAHVHPIRCFAFIHKPSFLRRVDNELSQNSRPAVLVHIVCALGAQFYALEYSTITQVLSPRFILRAGCFWAEAAYNTLLRNLDKISIDNLMSAQLLYDYALRVGNFAQAFMLGGLTARMAQALQINLEYSTDVLCQEAGPNLSVTAREGRRRLMWSCFVTDALLGSGVDQLMLIDEKDVKIQLPCNERRYLQETPCITRTLNGAVLGFLKPDAIPPNPDENMGLMAYFIQHIRVRKEVLRYIKHLDIAMSPWLADSEFAILDKACWDWYHSLPANLQFTTSTIYMRKASSQLGALVLLHCAHHQTLCDLYRLGAPALFKLRSAIEFPPEQEEFLRKMQRDLYDAAKALATIIGEAERHGPYTLSDTWLPTITYDSSRIMLYYLTQLIDPREQNSKDLVLQTIPYLQSNIRALKAMQALSAVSEPLCNAAETMLRRLGPEAEIVGSSRNIIPDDPYPSDPEDAQRPSPPGTPAQSAPDYVLNPLSIYRMARKTIPERHAPERIVSSTTNHSHHLDDVSPPTLNPAADELMFFTSDLGWAWQPAETAVGAGIERTGLHPWVGGTQLQDDGQQQVGSWGQQFPFVS